MEEGMMSGLKFLYNYRSDPDIDDGVYKYTFIIPKNMLEEALHPSVMANIAPLAALGKVLEFWSQKWADQRRAEIDG